MLPLGIGFCGGPILRFEVVGHNGQLSAGDIQVQFQTVPGKDGAIDEVAHACHGTAGDVLVRFGIVDMGADTFHGDVLASALDENADIDAPQVVSIQRQGLLEVVVEVDVVEISQRVDVLDFLNDENVRRCVENRHGGVVSLNVGDGVGD